MRFLNSPLIICCIDMPIWLGLTFYSEWIGAIPSPSEPREDGNFFRRVEWVRVLGVPTSKCSNSTTTGPYSCGFRSRDNDDLYLTNIIQILKIHVDFRVISDPSGWRHPIYQKVRNWLRNANKPLPSVETFKNHKDKPIPKSISGSYVNVGNPLV